MKKQTTMKFDPNTMYSLNHRRLTLDQFEKLGNAMEKFGIDKEYHYICEDKRTLTTTYKKSNYTYLNGFNVYFTSSLKIQKHTPLGFDAFMRLIKGVKVVQEPKTIHIAGYSTTITKDVLTVGCTNIPFEDVETVYKDMLKLRKK
jgi:hypothetical protein